jgi:GNAT superfamily N-acetyltransferase
MITYRLLSDEDFISLYDCFLTAFSDYAVDMRMSHEHFRQRLTRDGVSLVLSAAAFESDQMIGFCMNAFGEWQGKKTAYDGGMALIPAYRGRGVAKELLQFVELRLKEVGVSQYLLEVLTANAPAATLYRKHGFVETRRLAVFRSEPQKGPQKGTKETKGAVVIRRVERPDWRLFQTFWDGYPSWQNSIDAVERVVANRTIVGAYVNDECVGYGVVFRPSANLMQLAVAPAHRRQGFGSAILAALETEVSEPLRINNIDEDLKGSLAFYDNNGYKQVLGQYEMMKTL